MCVIHTRSFVKLVQGDRNKKRIEADAIALAKRFSIYPEINLIDLDAAFGTGDNLALIREICKICLKDMILFLS